MFRLTHAHHLRLRIRGAFGRLHQARIDRLALRRIFDQVQGGIERDHPYLSHKANGTVLFTTHKSASTLMMQVLRRIAMLNWTPYFDYERILWRHGERLPIADHERFLTAYSHALFRGQGELYGPIRYPIPINNGRPEQQLQTLFFLRDPRDVLVSAFHSFGYIHPVPANPEHAAHFLQERARIQAEGLEGFVMRRATEWIRPTLHGFRMIRDRSIRTQTIHYQDFSENPVGVALVLLDALGEARPSIRHAIVTFLEQQVPHRGISVTHRSNPTHIRSGTSRQFESSLAPETVRALTGLLEEELQAWGFAL